MGRELGMYLNLDSEYVHPEHVPSTLPEAVRAIRETDTNTEIEKVDLYVEFKRGETFNLDRTELRRFLLFYFDGMYDQMHIRKPDMLSSDPLEVLHVYNYVHQTAPDTSGTLRDIIGGKFLVSTLSELDKDSGVVIDDRLELSIDAAYEPIELGSVDGVPFRLISTETPPEIHERILAGAEDSHSID